ncbi:MAG TPA: glycosyltransferase [Pyrinomonadaceae bacterium]|jgi:glycosyltransferase involved in cell wall biosynthesis
MLRDRNIICISGIEWDFNWQNAQEMCSRLAAAGNRVLFVENMGIRSPGLKDAGRVWKRLLNWMQELPTSGVRRVGKNLYVCSPLVLPPFGVTGSVNARVLLPRVVRAARRLGMGDALILTYLPTDTALDLVRQLRTPRSVVVYYRIDNLAALTPHAEELRRSERAMIETSDLVLANSAELARLPSELSDNVHVFPPSVNLDAFTPEGDGADGMNGDAHLEPEVRESVERVRQLSHPLIGYVGAISNHINGEMVAASVRSRPEWSWVFVGPGDAPLKGLGDLPNVHFFGQQPHRSLANFIREFDVCIIPYRLNSYTATVVPTKLNEYLAVGKPVVSTDLPAVRHFEELHGVLTISDEAPENFLRAVESALGQSGEQDAARRREAAAHGDWDKRLEEVSALFLAAFRAKGA